MYIAVDLNSIFKSDWSKTVLKLHNLAKGAH